MLAIASVSWLVTSLALQCTRVTCVVVCYCCGCQVLANCIRAVASNTTHITCYVFDTAVLALGCNVLILMLAGRGCKFSHATSLLSLPVQT